MAFAFRTAIDVPPIPVGELAAARAARLVQDRVDAAGSRAAGVAQAVDVIVNANPAAPPSELLRLRLLLRDAHTRAELERLVTNTFDALGVTGP